MTEKVQYPLGELADLLDVDYSGNPNEILVGLATLSSAGPGHLSFFHNSRYIHDLRSTRASAVILHPDHVSQCPTGALIAREPYITFARASHLFAQPCRAAPGIHASAVVDASADIAPSASVGPQVTIGAGARVGDNVRIGAGCSIGEHSSIGRDGLLHANVSIYPGVHIGARAVIHSGAVIGGDGFGFAFDGAAHVKIAQLGGVRIGENVEIGAGSCIDRGALDDTVIEDGVKIDNQVQIAHNVRVGAHTVICGCSAIAGSSRIGKNCTIAGGVGIINHLTLADGVTVTAMSLVNQSIDQEGVYSSGTGLSESSLWRRNMVRFKQLDEMWKKLRQLEKAIRPNNKS